MNHIINLVNGSQFRALESEAHFQQRVESLLNIYDWYWFAQPTTQEQVKNRGRAGYPDLTAVSRDGRILFIELKKQGKYPTLAQQMWLSQLSVNGHVAVYVWRPSDWPEIVRVLSNTPTDGGAA